jgi:hypothetical protein
MPLDAPYTGGFSPGARIFAVDGDLSALTPHGPPIITFPFIGDSVFSINDVVLRVTDDTAPLGFRYQAFALGNRNNLQPWSPNQRVFTIDQKFKIAAPYFQPFRLNTRYDHNWALSWPGSLPDGFPIPALNDAILVHQGQVRDAGGGLFEFEMRFSTIPPTWNDFEQVVIKRIGLQLDASSTALRDPLPVMSRLQYDYFVYDETNILSDIALFTDPGVSGIRLNADTGFRPAGIILDAMKFYGTVLNQEVPVIYDADASNPLPSTPSLSNYESWMENGSGTSNGLPAEMVIEASTFSRYLGNIIARRTRFAIIE